MITVQELRSKYNYKVRVLHCRKKHLDGRLNTYGGTTIVELRTPSGLEYVGKAYCSDKDHYNKKLGVKIALGRALKKIELFTRKVLKS